MNGPKIAIVSMSEISSSMITERLRPLQAEALGSIQFQECDLAAIATRDFSSISVLILNLPLWSNAQAKAVQTLRERGYRCPILALVRDVKKWTAEMGSVGDFMPIRFLGKPFADAELVGLVRRMLSFDPSSSRLHPRYETQQPAEFDLSSDKSHGQCVMLNVSRGGACVDFGTALENGTKMEVGNIITLRVALDNEPTPKTLKGRVAWLKPGKGQAGIQFLDSAA